MTLPHLRTFLLVSSLAAGTVLALPASLTAQPAAAAIIPTEAIQLFNGKDLTNFYTWLVGDHYADPNQVFSVVDQVDGAPAIRISGQTYGGIITHNTYKQYRLIVEFRWGLATWGGRMARARDSGVLIHCQGADGSTRADFNGPWMRSVEAQIIEGGTGDFLLVGGFEKDGRRVTPTMTATVERARNGQPTYSPTGQPVQHTDGRINWYGRDPDWTDVLGYRGAQDVESLPDAWTKLEVIVEADRLTNIVNGRIVNVGTSPSLTEGKILIQSEGAEIFIRRVELQPLGGIVVP